MQGVSWVDPEAPKVIKKTFKPTKVNPDPLAGLFEIELDGEVVIVQYESDSELSEFELVPLTEAGGVAAFVSREVIPYSSDAWVDLDSEKIGYELSFTKHFYRPVVLRELSEIEADLRSAIDSSTGAVLAVFDNG